MIWNYIVTFTMNSGSPDFGSQEFHSAEYCSHFTRNLDPFFSNKDSTMNSSSSVMISFFFLPLFGLAGISWERFVCSFIFFLLVSESFSFQLEHPFSKLYRCYQHLFYQWLDNCMPLRTQEKIVWFN